MQVCGEGFPKIISEVQSSCANSEKNWESFQMHSPVPYLRVFAECAILWTLSFVAIHVEISLDCAMRKSKH